MIALMVAAGPAAAQDVVASLYSHNGTVPPPYHQSSRASVAQDGRVTVSVCTGYDDSGGACKTFVGQAAQGAVEVILAAARAAGLPERPLTDDPMPPIGGGATSGAVVIDGQTVRLPAFPIEADRARTQGVLIAIANAIPADLQEQAKGEVAE